MTDRWLMDLWSRAVRAIKGDQCFNPECSRPAHSIHHIIKRRYRVLRCDVKNGIPLCVVCHPKADRNAAFVLDMISEGDRAYLADMGVHTLKDWLTKTCQTREEFLQGEADELKDIIRGAR